MTTTRLVPSAALSSSNSSNTRKPVGRSRLPVGSSASTAAGRVTSARATAVRCRSPPESWLGTMLEPLAQAHALEQAARFGGRLLRRRAAHEQRHRDVLERRELRQQMMELIDEAERTIAQPAALRVAQRAHRLADDAHLACRRLIEAADELQQRRLARARRADDRDAIALGDGELDAAQHLDVAPDVAERLDELAGLEDRLPRHS